MTQTSEFRYLYTHITSFFAIYALQLRYRILGTNTFNIFNKVSNEYSCIYCSYLQYILRDMLIYIMNYPTYAIQKESMLNAALVSFEVQLR